MDYGTGYIPFARNCSFGEEGGTYVLKWQYAVERARPNLSTQ